MISKGGLLIFRASLSNTCQKVLSISNHVEITLMTRIRDL